MQPCVKFPSEEVISIVTIKSFICFIKHFWTKTLCICTYFLKENYGFHYFLLFPLALNLFDCSFSYALFHIFTLFSHNRHDHSRIRYSCKYFQYKILKFETSSVLNFPSKEAFHWIFYHNRHFDFEMWGKNLYTLRMKNPRMSNHHPPFFFSTHTTIIVPLSPPKVSFGFLAVVSIYQLECYVCHAKSKMKISN